ILGCLQYHTGLMLFRRKESARGRKVRLRRKESASAAEPAAIIGRPCLCLSIVDSQRWSSHHPMTGWMFKPLRTRAAHIVQLRPIGVPQGSRFFGIWPKNTSAELLSDVSCRELVRTGAATPGPLSLPTLFARRWVDLLYEP